MTFIELQKEVIHLAEHEQDVLAAYLTMLRHERDPEWEKTLSRKVREEQPDKWVELDEFLKSWWMLDYCLFINIEILDSIKSIRGSRRVEINEFLLRLRSDPSMKGDFQKDKEGRTLEVKVFGKYSIYFWADHAVKEVKVVELLKSDH